MRLCIIGDMHFRQELPYAAAFSDGRKSEWRDTLDKIVRAASMCDSVILLGDVLNSRHNHSSVLRELVEFLNRFGDKPVHIICGNHELYGLSTALDFLQKFNKPTWHVYTKITNNVQLGSGLTATFVPYLTPAMVGAQDKQEGVTKALDIMKPADVVFMHQGIAEGKSHGTAVDTFNEIVFPKEVLELNYGMTFAGHIHQPLRISEKVMQTGNIFPQEVGDTEKSVYIYEKTAEGSHTEVMPLPVRGIYKVIWDTDTEKIFGGIPATSIVKCIVTTRGTDIELVRETLKRFDASIIIEAYPNEREKTHFEDGALDLSVDGLLKLYAENKGLVHSDLVDGFELIKKVN